MDYFGRDQLKDESETSRLFQGQGLCPEALRGGLISALDPVPAQRMNGLRGKAQVTHDGDPSSDKGLHGFACGSGSTLQFHRLNTGFLQDPPGVPEGIFRRDLVG